MSGRRFDELFYRVCSVVFGVLLASAFLAAVVSLWRAALGDWL